MDSKDSWSEMTEPRLRHLADQVRAKLTRLASFDAEEHINSYCELIETEIIVAVESSVHHLNQLGDKLLDQVKLYRESLLEACNSRAAKRFKRSAADDLDSADDQLAELSAQVERFQRRWLLPSTEAFELAEQGARDLRGNIDQLEDKMVSRLFKGQFLKFKGNQAFFQSDEQIGKLVTENSMRGNVFQGENEKCAGQVFEQRLQRLFNFCLDELHRKIADLQGPVYAVLFLENGYLVTGSEDHVVKIWNPFNGELVQELAGHSDWVLSLACLLNG